VKSLRAQLLIWLLGGVAIVAGIGGWVVYRNALEEAGEFFDYHLQQTALILRAEPVEYLRDPAIPGADPSYDFVIQVWSLDGVRVYLSRPHAVLPGLTTLGFSTVETSAGRWRVYGTLSARRVIQVAQPMQIRERNAARLAVRTVVPFVLAMPVLAMLILLGVGKALRPLRQAAAAVKSRPATSLEPLPTDARLPEEVRPLIDSLNDLLRRLNKVLGRERAFLADAAHELRTPITALQLQAEMLMTARDEAERAEAAAHLTTGFARVNRLVEQLLSLTRHEPKEAATARQPVSLDELAREVVAELVPLADARQIDLGVSETTPLTVMGDGEALRTLLRNLVDNAVRYTPSGGRVDVLVQSGVGSKAAVQVIDTGPGIPESEKDRVFDRFYRVPGTNTAGSGLGLAIAKAIADAHGATLSLGTAPTGGLAVTLEMPSLAPS